MLKPLTPQSPARIQWEENVTRHFCQHFDVARGDAQGMLETYPRCLDRAFEVQASPDEVAATWQAITGHRQEYAREPILLIETQRISGGADALETYAAVAAGELLEVARGLDDSAHDGNQTGVPFGSNVTVEVVAPFQLWSSDASVSQTVKWTSEGIVLTSWWASTNGDAEISTRPIPLKALECLATLDTEMVLYWGRTEGETQVLDAIRVRDRLCSVSAQPREAKHQG